MITIGSYEAKTHLPELLRKVEAGEQVIITRHGKPIARLMPTEAAKLEQAQLAKERIMELRKTMPKFTIEEIMEWRHEGHRF